MSLNIWLSKALLRLKKQMRTERVNTWAKHELELLEKQCGDDKEGLMLQKIITKNVLDVMRLIAKQHHSGFSYGYFKRVLLDLMDNRPLTPLTGEADEWGEEGQNKRMTSVFRCPDGSCFWTNARCFVTGVSRSAYTNGHSRMPITEFPWSPPATVTVHVKQSCSDFDPDFKCDYACDTCANRCKNPYVCEECEEQCGKVFAE